MIFRQKFAPACADTLESIAENMLAHTPDRQFTESPELLGLSLSTHLQVRRSRWRTCKLLQQF